mgnify:CR=1 FL=1
MIYAGGPTLGWAVLDDLSDVLPSPSDQDEPLRLTDEQACLLLRWYEVDSESGEFLYRRGCLEMAKGWGKSPLLACLAIAELSMPVLFDGWVAPGIPRRRPWGTGDSPPPWVQIAAVSEDQTENTYAALYELLTANEGRAAQTLGIDEGRTRLYLRGRPGRLEPVTASAGSREGQRLTFAVLDETHLWTRRNRGVALARTLRRNAAKMDGRTFETTNAPALGEKSVAETSGAEAETEPGILFHARRPQVEPDPNWPDEKLLGVLHDVYGDARWIDRERILAEVRDPASPWDESLRFYFNLRVSGAGRAVDPRRWDELARLNAVDAKAWVGLGFDGSISRDATVLVACTREGFSWVLGYWRRPPGDEAWKVPRKEVNDAVADAFARYNVGRMNCDPPKWYTEIEDWTALYGGEDRVVALDTNQPRRFAPAVDRWLTAIREGTHTHDGDARLAEHVKAANLRKVRLNDPEDDGRTMYVLAKDGRLIDAAVADVLAYEAAMAMPEVKPQATPTVVLWDDDES